MSRTASMAASSSSGYFPADMPSRESASANASPHFAGATELRQGSAAAEPLSIHVAVAKAALDLRRNGWAVVDDVIPRAECEAYIDSVWIWLESLGTGTIYVAP